MKRLLLILLFISFQSLAYEEKDINLSDFGFNRYVRPQLINISSEFQTLLLLINPELKNFQSQNKVFFSLQADLSKVLDYKKFEQFDLLGEKLQSIIKKLEQLMSLVSEPIDFSQKKFFTPEDAIQSYQAQTLFNAHLFDFYQRTQNFYFFNQAGIQIPISIEKYVSEFNNIYNQFFLFLLKSTDNRFRSEFVSFWSDFIKPVHQSILPRNDKVLFVHLLNKFNLRINFLHAKLTKRNKTISKQVNTIAGILF